MSGTSSDLTKQLDACSVLLDIAESIPDPLAVELDAYVRQLNYAMSSQAAAPEAMTDADALDAVAGVLLGPEPDQGILEAIRAILKRSGR